MGTQVDRVRSHLLSLQQNICEMLVRQDGHSQFVADPEVRENGSLSQPMILSGPGALEKAAVNFSHSIGKQLPPAATERNPEFAGCGFQAVSLSLIVHPKNPYVPTTHANFRYFQVDRGDEEVDWWFGGGYDLTPYYGCEEDVVHWHKTAKAACDKHGAEIYANMKQACDAYFFIPHRGEARGVGGIFFDDWYQGGFESSFAMVQDLSNSFIDAYEPIVTRRKRTEYGERERAFQLFRRGRYVEFNLVYDRGTKYGLQSARRTETVMASMPPSVTWHYKYPITDNSPEQRLYTDFLPHRDWI